MRSKTSAFFFGLVLYAIILSASGSAQAQTALPSPSPTPQAAPTPTLEHEFFRNILRDQVAIWTAPFHLHQRDVRWLAQPEEIQEVFDTHLRRMKATAIRDADTGSRGDHTNIPL